MAQALQLDRWVSWRETTRWIDIVTRELPVNELEELVRNEIRRDGPITFARFMEVALYHPALGYYAGGGLGREPLGWEGDYFTSGDVHPLWGWSVARQLHQMWELMGRPTRFDVVEAGAGRGLLACEVWRYARERAPDWAETLQYTLVDRAPSDAPLRQARERRLAAEMDTVGGRADAVRWMGELPPDEASLTGCVVSNELVDALPVHVVEAYREELREIYVGQDERTGRLVEISGASSSPALAAYLDAFRIPWRTYPVGWRCEICLEAEGWLRGVAGGLKRGFLLTIDYGDTARKLYTAERRRGTLAVYARHQLGERPLANVGRQDITAHVNFTALVRAGRAHGLRLAGLTTQARFLRGLGIREEAEALAARLYPAADTERHTDRGQVDYLRKRNLLGAVSTLLNPYGLGGFRVLVQHRGMPGVGRELLGLRREASLEHERAGVRGVRL